MSWQTEFGADWDVPADVVAGLVDISWGNDAWPTFIRADDPKRDTGDMPKLRLCVDHPDDDKREFPGGKRFIVATDIELGPFSGVILETDDGAEAREFLLAYQYPGT